MKNTSGLMTAHPHGKTRKTFDYCWHTTQQLADWTVTDVASGTGAVSSTVPGGALVLTGAATTDNSGANIQLKSAPLKLAAEEWADFLIKIRMSDVIESDLMVGFGVVDTSVIAGISDFVGIRKVDGAALLEGVFIRDGGTPQVLPLGNMVNDTQLRLGFSSYVSQGGAGRTIFWVNGSAIGQLEHATNHLSENQNTPTIAFQSGDNLGTKTCTVKRVGFAWSDED